MASIYRQKNSSFYWIKYYLNGRMVRESLKTDDQKVARYLKNKKEQSLSEGRIPAEIRNVSASEAIEEYLKYCDTYKTRSTSINDRTRINTFLKTCRPTSLRDITSKSIEDYISGRIRGGNKIITANGDLTVIKAFLNWCVKQHYLPASPAKDIRRTKTPENLPRFLSTGDIKKLLTEAAKEDIYPMIATALYTGLRKGELLSLEWQDIDFDKNAVHVVNKPGFTTKSKKFRVIPLVPALKQILAPFRKAEGRCFSKRNLRRQIARIFRNASLGEPGLHILRHTFASQLIMKGVDLVTVKDLLGHADIATTMIYSHLSKDHIKQAINKLKF
jgi:site-specific recombinase XerD